MDCDHSLELMSQALDGPLSPAQQAELSAHLNTCPHCAALYRELTEQSAALRALDAPFPEGLHQRILDQLPAQQQPKGKGRLVSLRRWGALAACAALVVALAAALPWGGNTAQPAGYSGAQAALYSLSPGDTRTLESPAPDAPEAAGTRILCARLPDGWQQAVGDASGADSLLSGAQARAFLALLEEQGIPYTLEGDDTLSGTCQLILTEEPAG